MTTDPLLLAETALKEARAAQEAVNARAADARAYDGALAALGRRPVIPAGVDEPAPPVGDRPTGQESAAARLVLDTARTVRAMHTRETERVSAAIRQLAAVAERLAAATVEAERVTGLVAALRKAPALAAQRQRARLGTMAAPGVVVDVLFGDPDAKQGALCWLEVNGRPWELASRGERVVACALLRAAVRREGKMPALPLGLDDVGAWNGGARWPDLPGPVYMLETDDGNLRVGT